MTTEPAPFVNPALPLEIGATAEWRSPAGTYQLTQVDADTMSVTVAGDPSYEALITRTDEFYDITSNSETGNFTGTAETWDEILATFLGRADAS
ncbi:hypothetical protein G3T36_10960 [Diaminobutyricibacter tongyongensis]|uniref:Uncharacterized protein n=1 Tax=Leifsonia tongyongensis TaxID=1268043 RepID=A0A6L9XYA5_9MICO|nr:hypothetical protein [Diaminobutyricibacter tongyongensis]NEN06393.1 hypothetical protein [Diaminobutyricibacter tongyongensis]